MNNKLRNRVYQRRYRANHKVELRCMKRKRKRTWWWKVVSKTQPWDL